MKKVLCLIIAVLMMLLSMCACSASEGDIVGAWKGEDVYLSSYNCTADQYLYFGADGSFMRILVNDTTSDILNYSYGDWNIDGSNVVVKEDGDPGQTIYKYSGNSLTNGKWTYKKSAEAKNIFDDLLS